MKKIGILHTVRSVYESFPLQVHEKLGNEIEISNMLDDYLVTETKKLGSFPVQNWKKLYLDILSLEFEDPDLIIVSCSSLTPYIKEIEKSFSVDIICIDDKMCKDAINYGRRIAVVATAPTTVQPTVNKITKEAALASFSDIEINSFLIEDAMAKLSNGDILGHDKALCSISDSLKDYDVIVFAQASMSSAKDAMMKKTGKPVLCSPELCIEEIKQYFN